MDRSRSWPRLFTAILGLLLFTAPALAQTTYDEGDPVDLSVGQIPSGYATYWVSSLDDYLGTGNPFRTTQLSVGKHTITAYIFRTRDWVLVWRGALSLEVVAPAQQPNPPATGGVTAYAPGEHEDVSTFVLGCNDTYMVGDLYPQFLNALRGVVETLIYVDSAYVQYDLIDIFDRTGVDDTDHTFVVTPIDSIWMRDYGPLFVKNGSELEVVDLDYYGERPNDDAVPRRFAQRESLAVRALPVAWEGGNYTSDGRGNLFATSVLYDANAYDYNQTTVERMVEDAFEGNLHVLEPMLDDGGTGHLDMFCAFTGPSSVLINRFPSNHQNYARMNRQADRLQQLGLAVTRLDLADRGFKSHTNGVLVNDVALVPTYASTRTDAAVLAAYRTAGYRAVGIDCRNIIAWSGAIHCICVTVPQ